MQASDSAVRQLGYLVFECAPGVLEAMTVVYGEIIGAAVEPQEGGAVHVRLDGRPFRLRLEPGETSRLAAIGWEVPAPGFDALVARVAATGAALSDPGAEVAAARGAARIMRMSDADGFVHEFHVDLPFAEDAALKEKFVCGDEANGTFGLGHIVQIVGDLPGATAFYTDVLGFDLSDRITWPAADLFFLHCNQRHHTVALSAPAFGMPPGAVHHLMFEAKSRDQVDAAYAKLGALGFPVIMTIGQHTNDEVYSFYMGAPAGYAIEFGFGGKVVDRANWEYKTFDAPSSWGHELQLAPQP
ncbi:VOC family protein [Novosphingobium sp.]|mgnify:CR=1 FL=1|jgi:2,3-dihydroxybiphenyl 1,2-dioxygenase|uniref:VOC family protein n=1 Tax=Novosphingobium sp. TaxID=1874826 RepID=UPI001EB71812|nr:VOC family protein [Novosphingobium sp.]MBK6803213.1 VOC family protein [Novosphingobium sp.]MBK9011935.1 VOC family protein [Novosphingobium sp.]